MGIMVGLPSPSGSEKDLQLNFGKNMTVQVEMRAPHLPAEWHMSSVMASSAFLSGEVSRWVSI